MSDIPLLYNITGWYLITINTNSCVSGN